MLTSALQYMLLCAEHCMKGFQQSGLSAVMNNTEAIAAVLAEVKQTLYQVIMLSGSWVTLPEYWLLGNSILNTFVFSKHRATRLLNITSRGLVELGTHFVGSMPASHLLENSNVSHLVCMVNGSVMLDNHPKKPQFD